jgi:Xaa-Pro aminopeptidase
MDEAAPGSAEVVLFIAASEGDANLYWATGFLAGDPFIYVEAGGERTIVASELELGRARREARVDRVVSSRPYDERIRAAGEVPKITDIADLFLREIGARRLTVPAGFPLGRAEELRRKGWTLEVREEPFYPERIVKRPDEIARIEAAQAVTEEAMARAVDIIAGSWIDGDRLLRDGEVLTSEAVRRDLQRFLLDRGYLATDIIVAGGEGACEPHLRGSGPLPPHRPIVIDIFPRSLETRYWGDMTRTVVRGTASARARRLFDDVLAAQALGISLIRDGAEGSEIHETREAGGRMEGFIHGTGHGVGIDLHEPPRISRLKSTLPAGAVVSVEPGLYYADAGGVRIEDLVVVEEDGARSLNRFPKVLEI